MDKPLFTVATITYNSGKWVSQAIESILSSSFSDFELLISDDCSTDNTWEIIQRYKDTRIISWRNDANIGEYPNRNKVLNRAKGKYLVIVDGDDILYRNSLFNLKTYVDYFPDLGMLLGVSPQWFENIVLPYELNSIDAVKLLYDWECPMATIGFGEIVFNIDKLRDVGGFPIRFKTGDLFLKKYIALRHSVVLIPFGVVFWRNSPGQASKKINLTESFLERKLIEDIILHDSNSIPEEILNQLRRNVKISLLKNLVCETILKGKFLIFFKLVIKMKLSVNDFRFLLMRSSRIDSVRYRKDALRYNKFNFITNLTK
jgi:glycosyltransferase involved in cell wall biosynthesis